MRLGEHCEKLSIVAVQLYNDGAVQAVTFGYLMY